MGITNITVVPEQELPNGEFPTCPYPNPEFREALELGLELCKKVQPDLLLATDPDCDRVGIAVPDGNGGYALFSGNETGVMLLEYIARERIATGTMPENPVAVKSIVTTTLTEEVGKEYGVEIIATLTGFKNICGVVAELEKTNEEARFLYGFEESYGYVSGTYVRDKDAVVASMLICEMAAFYRSKGISLIEARAKMYEKYGVFNNSVDNFAFEGASGMEKMSIIMQGFRDKKPLEIAGIKVIAFSDFEAGEKLILASGEKTKINLPKTNMVIFGLEGSATVIVRPSGTEPKIKVYYTTVGKTQEEAEKIREKLSSEMKGFFK
jgi:phosphoglucomutase